MNIDQIRAHIDRLIKEKGKNYRSLSLAIGKNEAYLHQYINKGSPLRLPEQQRRKLANLLEVDEQELTDISLPKPAVNSYGSARTAMIEMISSDTSEPTTSGFFSIPVSEFSNITSSSPDLIKMIRINGDSMSPTLKDGDYAFIDFGASAFKSDGLYLIRFSGNLLIKRLQQTASSELTIISDNTNYKNITLNIKKIDILGKVIFTLKTEKIA